MRTIISITLRIEQNEPMRIVFLSLVVEHMTPTFKFAVDPTDLYANWIYDAIKAPGADNEDLIRLILSRAEINLQNIKDAYRAISEKTLIEDIEEVTSGDYKNMLVALVNGNFEELQDCKTENS
ncbi:unnamed protein product [Rodentolepis nana]|uniref:Annexin n=1 Tax=Rodentolepis nana TaxID=102285 RepID=A0A0R3TZN7_RODNA|nr:unnamed protein product [Rodentolepis nana]